MAIAPISTPTRSLRASTLEKKAQQEAQPRKYANRKYVDITQAPSIKLSEGHSCADIYPDHAQDKAQRRFLTHYIRYAITEALSCETSRGKTRLQAGKSSCDCESAHFAATPTMHDNKMTKVVEHLNNKLPMTPTKTGYVAARLGLDSPEKMEFGELSPSSKKTFIQGRASPEDYHNSFCGTPFELQMSGTIEGSVITNDFDQKIEVPIRKFEDEYCEEISKKNMTAQEATEASYTQTCKFMETCAERLQLRKEQLEKYFALERVLDKIEKDYLVAENKTDWVAKNISQIDEYANAAKDLLEEHRSILKKTQYSMNFDKPKLSKYCQRRDFFWIKAFSETYEKLGDRDDKISAFQDHIGTIKKSVPDSPPEELITNIDKMIEEAQNQLLGITSLGECNVANISLLLFGICEKGVRRAPTKKELTEQIIAMTKKELNPNKKKLAIRRITDVKIDKKTSTRPESRLRVPASKRKLTLGSDEGVEAKKTKL